LENVIYDISPTDTPFHVNGRSHEDAIAVNHEWQTDALADAADNHHEEGVTLTAAEPTATISPWQHLPDQPENDARFWHSGRCIQSWS
jgi:hypothetical protein